MFKKVAVVGLLLAFSSSAFAKYSCFVKETTYDKENNRVVTVGEYRADILDNGTEFSFPKINISSGKLTDYADDIVKRSNLLKASFAKDGKNEFVRSVKKNGTVEFIVQQGHKIYFVNSCVNTK